VTVREWVKGDPNAGLKWLGCRRPDQYRKQEVKTRELGGGFLAALEAMNERAKLPERSRLVNGPKLIEQKPDPGHQDGGREQG
jgi:hypothetical protein